MIRTGIVGASGYTGAELARLLFGHPQVELVVATSRQYAGQPLAKVFPHLQGRVDLVCEMPDMDRLVEKADLFFTAVPHKTAMEIVPSLLDAGKKVVDLSADFRIRETAVYEAWYQQHSASHLLDQAVYGLPELYRDKIAESRLVANPGCYPTSIILGLAPLLQNGLILPESVIIDSKSGASGAGRSALTGSLFCEVNDGFKAYKVGRAHRHTPEIEQELSLLAKKQVNVTFTPHLLPLSRGILSTIYASLRPGVKTETLLELYQGHYANEPFIRVLEPGCFPTTQHVRGSNFCDIGLAVDEKTGRVILMSAIDNIVKGASGQAIQNMNILCGLQEDAGLTGLALFP